MLQDNVHTSVYESLTSSMYVVVCIYHVMHTTGVDDGGYSSSRHSAERQVAAAIGRKS
jgi:hypothetical protein